MTTALVLAAGASSRLGQPKALVPIEGKPAIARLCGTLRDAGCQVIVVHAEGAVDVVLAVPLYAKKIANPQPKRGRTGSLKLGLRTIWRDASFLVAPVDHPTVSVRTVSALLRAKGEIRVPTYRGQRGHPVYFSSQLRNEILDLGDDEPLHHVVHREPGRVAEVPVEDEGILFNLDTPDDLKKLAANPRGPSDARDAA